MAGLHRAATFCPTKLTATTLRRKNRAVAESVIETALFLCACVSVVTTVGIVAVLLYESVQFFGEVSPIRFLTETEWTPLFHDKKFGIIPLVCGTALTSVTAMSIALPFGITIALYLSEFASERQRRTLKPLLEILAGIPTIVYGYFALFFVTPILQKVFPSMGAFNALSPGLVMGFMILPMVASLSEDAMYAVPRSLREGAYALGATKLQMSLRVLIPAALGGIVASVILAISRAVGETMIVAIAAGQQPNLTLNVLESVETMTAFIVKISLGDTPHGTLEYRTIFAVGLSLFVITLTLNMLAVRIRERFRNRYV